MTKRLTKAYYFNYVIFSVMPNLLLWQCFAHQQPSACWNTENMGQGRIYLVSCRVNSWHLCEIQGMTNKTENAHQDRSWFMKNLFFEHSSLTSPLTCGSILWDRSSPQAAIWKSREEWRYAGRGTSGLFWVCTDRKCNGWEIYTQPSPDMDLYFCVYKPAKWSVITCFWLHYLFVMLNDSLLNMWWSQSNESSHGFIMHRWEQPVVLFCTMFCVDRFLFTLQCITIDCIKLNCSFYAFCGC